jgi:DNA-binding LytR/AlgR family response regulator
MIKALIVDDEAPAHKVLEAYCSKVPDLQIVGNCFDATSALHLLREQDVDLMFLDIQMSDLTGLELLQTLPKVPQVVLVTAYAEHALKSYEFGVTDYLLKPVRYARFLQAVEKVGKRLQQTNTASPTRVPVLPNNEPIDAAVFLTVEEDGLVIKVQLTEILWAESVGNYVKLQTIHKKYSKRMTLSELETVFKPHGFLRVHKSFLIRLDAIEALDGNQIRITNKLMANKFIPVGATYRQIVRDTLKGIC